MAELAVIIAERMFLFLIPHTRYGGKVKGIFLTLAVRPILFSYALAQTIPNGGFESWTGGLPNGWTTSDLPGFFSPVTQSSDAHSGSSAAKGTVIAAFGGLALTPTMEAGTPVLGIPVNSRIGALHGWYKFSSDSGDAFSATVSVLKAGNPIGVGLYLSGTIQSVYTEFVANISYLNMDVPDTALIFILITNSKTYHLGSTFTLDDLSFGSPTAVNETAPAAPEVFSLAQNYPNPFNPTTMIQFEIAERGPVTLKVYNVLGENVATLINQTLSAGRYRAEFDAHGFPSGTYFYRLQSGTRSEVRRMNLIK